MRIDNDIEYREYIEQMLKAEEEINGYELVPESFLWENTEVPLTMRIDELSDLEELLYGIKKAANIDGIQFLRELFLKKFMGRNTTRKSYFVFLRRV